MKFSFLRRFVDTAKCLASFWLVSIARFMVSTGSENFCRDRGEGQERERKERRM